MLMFVIKVDEILYGLLKAKYPIRFAIVISVFFSLE
tara:strand:- start:14 stop:121 length:108 start_codon:yes stop_codon:yes gene_type:complete